MQEFSVSYPTGLTGLFVRAVSPAGQIWNTNTLAFEAWNGANVANYAIALVETSIPGLYVGSVATAWPAGTYRIVFYNPAISSSPADSGLFFWTGTAELTPADATAVATLLGRLTAPRAALMDNMDATVSSRSTYAGTDTAGVTELLTLVPGVVATAADIAALQSHGDTFWLSSGIANYTLVDTQLGTGEVLWGEFREYQHAAFGPFIFPVGDSQKPPQPVDLSGHDITFVCSDQDDTFLWKIENCTVMGDYSNLVKVEADDTNTIEAGNFRYVLRDVTTDKVLAHGRLMIEAAADVA